MNSRVTNRDFKYLKRLFMVCLKENPDIEQKLDNYYKLIQVYFFFEMRDKNILNVLKETLKDTTLTYSPRPIPATALSKKNIGVIIIFLKHLQEFTQKRKDIVNIENYHKNGIFEELCHLVEQKGDSTLCPNSLWELWRMYEKQNLLQYGSEIICKLDENRNHYDVYYMMLKAYPNQWIERFSTFFSQTPAQFEQQYEHQKIEVPKDIVYARLITDFFKSKIFLSVAEKAENENLTEENKKLLNATMEYGRKVINTKRDLMEKDMGLGALSLIDSLDESVFKTPEIFFSVVLDLWKNLKLI